MEIPLVGGWKRKISRIDRMALIDCVPNPVALVLGVAVAFFHVFWVVHGPECVDSAYDRMQRPGRKHRKFNARGTAVGPSIPAPSGTYGTTAISLADAAQRIGLGIGIIDGVLDGVYYGASLTRRYSGCVNATADYAQLAMGEGVIALLPAQDFIIASWHEVGARGFFTDASGVAMGFGFADNITAMFSVEQSFNQFPPLQDCTFTTELIWLPSGDPVRRNWGGLSHTINGTGVLFGQDIIKHASDAFVAVLCKKTFGVCTVKSGSFIVIGGSIMGNLNPIECHPGQKDD